MNLLFRTFIKLSLLIIFNIFFWLLCGTDNQPAVWVSYVLIHLVYVFYLACGLLVANAHGQMVLSAGRYITAGLWAVVEMILGTFFIILAKNGVFEEITWPLTIQLCVGILFVCAFGFEFLTGGASAKALAQAEEETDNLNKIKLKLKAAVNSLEDATLVKEIEGCIDLVSASPIQSNGSVKADEHDIFFLASSIMDKAIAGADTQVISVLCKRFKAALTMRNEKLKGGI